MLPDTVIVFLQGCLSTEQKKQESGYEDMRLKLAEFQAQLANEDVRFVERENDLITKQKSERDNMTRAYQVSTTHVILCPLIIILFLLLYII